MSWGLWAVWSDEQKRHHGLFRDRELAGIQAVATRARSDSQGAADATVRLWCGGCREPLTGVIYERSVPSGTQADPGPRL